MKKFEWQARIVVEGVLPAEIPKTINKDCVLEREIEVEGEQENRAALSVRVFRRFKPSPQETDEVAKIALERAETFVNLYSLIFGRLRILYVESVDQVTPYKGKRQFLQTLRVIGRVRVPENTWTERIDALKVIEKRTMRKYQSLALSHYNLALWTARRSSFLNAMICIESLYNDSPIELRYRMAHRMANLLGRTAKLRRRIFKEFSDLYAVRNALIHGQKPVEVSDEDRELLLIYSRYSLITFLRLNQNKGHVLKEIDHAIYHKGNREEIQRKIGDILEVLEQKLEGMHASSSQ